MQGAAITALQTAGPDEINATKMQDEDVGNFIAIAPMALRNKISLGSLRLLMQKVNPCCLWAGEPQSKDSSCCHAYPGQVISEPICIGLLHFQHFLVCMVPDMMEPCVCHFDDATCGSGSVRFVVHVQGNAQCVATRKPWMNVLQNVWHSCSHHPQCQVESAWQMQFLQCARISVFPCKAVFSVFRHSM